MWINRDTPEEDMFKELQKIGLVIRNNSKEMSPQTPYQRALTFTETKLMREKFGNKFRWTDIDRDGNIILIHLHHPHQVGRNFITKEDLTQELKRIKNG